MSGYIGNAPVPQATQTRDDFTATSGQTTFATSGYTPGYLDVYLNGVKLATSDYTATNGSDVVLTVGAATGDILSVIAWTTFEATNVDYANVTNTPTLATVATTGSYSDLSGTPTLATVATTGAYSDLSGTPTLATVATTGAYSDLTGSPTAVSSFTNDSGYATTTYVDTAESDAVTTANAYTDSALAGISSDAITEGNSSVEVIDTGADGRVVFTTEGAEAARIDSSGNLLVGTTDNTLYDNTTGSGVALTSGGRLDVNRSADLCAIFNRTGNSNGAIQQFRKDGSVVGSIGTGDPSGTGNLEIESSSNNLYLTNTNGSLVYRDNGSGSRWFAPYTTAIISLGDEANRWKNIHLSGNAYYNSGYGSSAIAYGTRAWVNFNGTGTVAIRTSGNVSSITDNGTGDYSINFSTAMPDANYSVGGSCVKGDVNDDGNANIQFGGSNSSYTSNFTTTKVRAKTRVSSNNGAIDCAVTTALIVR